MKKAILLTMVLSLTMSTGISYAQKDPGTLTIYPRVGMNCSKLAGDEIEIFADGSTMNAKYKTGITAGAEIHKQLTKSYAISAGLFYSNMGTSFDNTSFGRQNTFQELAKIRYSLHYLQVPILLNAYIARNLAVKIGVGAGFLLSAKYKYESETWTEENGIVNYEKSDVSGDLKNLLKTLDIFAPLGISYEYRNISVDLRYNFGLMKVYKDYFTSKNRGVFLTLGYGIDLQAPSLNEEDLIEYRAGIKSL